MLQRRHYLLLILFACFVLSGLGGNYLAKISGVPSSNQNKILKKPFEQQVVTQDAEILFGIYYLTCKHLIKEIPNDEIRGLTFPALLKKYPSDQGWIVDTLNPKHIMIYKKQEGLCPEDNSKRHLGVKGEFVAVYRGPVGLDGGIERVTDIRVNKLPQEYQIKLNEGKFDFASENELMEALDTMDEYKE